MSIRFSGTRTPLLSGRDRRTLVGGAGLMGAMLAGTHGLPALRGYTELSVARATAASAEEAGVRERIVRFGRVTDSARARGARLAERELALVRGATPAASAAELGAIVRELASESDMALGAVTVTADTTAGGPHFIRVRASSEGTGDVDALATLLDGFEAGRTRLVVRELSVERTGQPVDAESGRLPLRVRFVVEGMARRRVPLAPRRPSSRGAP